MNDLIDYESLASETFRLDEFHVDLPPPSQAMIAQDIWKYQWYSQSDWLDFSFDLGRVFWKVYKAKDGHSVYAKEG